MEQNCLNCLHLTEKEIIHKAENGDEYGVPELFCGCEDSDDYGLPVDSDRICPEYEIGD